MAQYLGLARDSRKAAGLTPKAPWVGDALKSRDTARSIAKRVLTLSLGLGIGLAGCSRAFFPALLGVVCQSKEVASLVSRVCIHVLACVFSCLVCGCGCEFLSRSYNSEAGLWRSTGGRGGTVRDVVHVLRCRRWYGADQLPTLRNNGLSGMRIKSETHSFEKKVILPGRTLHGFWCPS